MWCKKWSVSVLSSDLTAKLSSMESTSTAKERELVGLREEVATAKDEAARQRQEADRISAKAAQTEARLTDLQADFECQRHNGEATRANLEKKLKEQVALRLK